MPCSRSVTKPSAELLRAAVQAAGLAELAPTLQTLAQLHIAQQNVPPQQLAADLASLARAMDALPPGHASRAPPPAADLQPSPAHTQRQQCAGALARLTRRVLKSHAQCLSAPQADELMQVLCSCAATVHQPPAALGGAAAAECMRALSAVCGAHLPRLQDGTRDAFLRLLILSAPSPGSGRPLDPTQTSLDALCALEATLRVHATALPEAWLLECLSALINSLHGIASRGPALVADGWHCGAYATLLSCVQHAIAATSAAVSAHVASLVDALSRFWALQLPPRVDAARRTYVPPHRRRGNSSDSASSSDTSATPAADPTAAVRLAALGALTAALHADPAALHPLWDRLLPATLAEGPQRATTLAAVLLRDPEPTCRAAAAGALQLMLGHRRARAFMAIAEEPGPLHTTGARAFVPLSATLAAMLAALHAALAQSLRDEVDLDVRLATLKVAGSLAANTPYQRLAAGLADELLQATLALWAPCLGAQQATAAQVLFERLHVGSALAERRGLSNT